MAPIALLITVFVAVLLFYRPLLIASGDCIISHRSGLLSYLLGGAHLSSQLQVMILSSNLGRKTHYEIIGVKEDASQEEIRRTYRAAILNFHPDKLLNSSDTSNHQFLEVQGAWKVLGDPRSRALYDNDLRKLRQDAVTGEEVSLEDMTIEDDDDSCFELCYHCRCGDVFSIDSSELAEMGYQFSRNGSEISFQASETHSSSPSSVILSCGSCSLKIRLIIDASVKLQVELKN